MLPSYHEGMANTNLEAASSGRPIITSDIPGCRESVINQKSGLLCKPQNTENLYCIMKSMIHKGIQEREKYGIEGRNYMKNSFSKQQVVSKTIEKLKIC